MCEDGGRRFAFNEEKRVGCCFHATCNWFYQRGGVSEQTLTSFFKRQGIPYRIPETINRSIKGAMELPKEYELLDELAPLDLRDNLFAYLASRGLPKKIVRAANVGYCKTGKYWGYLIFPVTDQEGAVQYWQARRYKNREPKFWNPASSKKKELVYRITRKVEKPARVVIVESIINALTIISLENRKDLVIAILGKTLSDFQRDHILQYKRWLLEVVIALDGPQERDDTKHAAVVIATSLEGIIPAVKIAKFPEGEDVNSIGREKSWDLINKAIVFHKDVNQQEFLHGAWT